MITIAVIGDEVQPAALTVQHVTKALKRLNLQTSTFAVRGTNWFPHSGFAAAAGSAERGNDVSHIPPEMQEVLSRADVLVTHYFPVRANVLNIAPNVKTIATLRHGTENIDTTLAEELGIHVINNPGREAENVSEFAVTLILDMLRGLTRAVDLFVRLGWQQSFASTATARSLVGATIGIVGFGLVGRRVASKLRGFGCEILVHDPFAPDDSDDPSIECVSLRDLLVRADVVTLHVRNTSDTRGMIGAAELALMRPDSYLVNTARADLVDHDALLAVLESELIAGVALDVLWQEPLIPNEPLSRLPNVLLTPHMAGTTANSAALSASLLSERLALSLTNQSPQLTMQQTKGQHS